VFAVLLAGQPVDVAALRAFAAAGLSPLEVPSRFIFRDDLPKTVIGKPDKSALRRLAAPGQSDKHPAS
jgi:non-ribosomal peptide synthetase component E (peptide arylation enzyme)